MIDFSQITLDQLTKRHPERIRWEPKWSDYRLLYRGGDDFLRSCGQLVNTRLTSTLQSQVTNALTPQAFSGLRNRRFLYQFEGESDPVYYALWNRAYYINYFSAISDYFRHWLFSEDPVIRPREGDDPPDWWRDFYENANGSGKGFCDVAKDSFLDVLIGRRAGWLVGKNVAVAEQDDADDSVVLTPYPAEQIYDWEKDATGKLLWVVLGTREMFRQFPGERLEVETYTYLDREQWATWQIKRGEDYYAKVARGADKNIIGEGDELSLIGQGNHGLPGQVPFVMTEIPEGLWLADKLAMPCVDLFNKQVRLTNAQLMGCIMQPFIKTSESRENAMSRIIGENTLLHLRVADAAGGGEEDFGWKTPDTGPLEFIAAQLSVQRDEVYRIVHQMALAVDSKAIGAIARSGASKIEDRKAAEIILAAYGGYVAPAMVQTANMLSEIYGDGTQWTLDGFKNFNVSSLDEEIQIAALVQTMNFKSVTARQELELKTLGRVLDFVDETTKEKIEQETRDAYEMEEEAKNAPPEIPHVVGPNGQPVPAVGAPIGNAASVAKTFGGVKPMQTLGDKAENTKATYGK